MAEDRTHKEVVFAVPPPPEAAAPKKADRGTAQLHTMPCRESGGHRRVPLAAGACRRSGEKQQPVLLELPGPTCTLGAVAPEAQHRDADQGELALVKVLISACSNSTFEGSKVVQN